MDGITKANADAKIALSNISFKAEANQLIVVVGPIGSGKSTLLHSLMNETELCSPLFTITGKIAYVE